MNEMDFRTHTRFVYKVDLTADSTTAFENIKTSQPYYTLKWKACLKFEYKEALSFLDLNVWKFVFLRDSGFDHIDDIKCY